jgi:FkbM family methyltransferase
MARKNVGDGLGSWHSCGGRASYARCRSRPPRQRRLGGRATSVNSGRTRLFPVCETHAVNDRDPTALEKRLEGEFFGLAVREARELAALPRLFDGCNCFVDVGANIGQYTAVIAALSSDAEIVAIEANPEIIPILARRAKVWERMHGAQIQVVSGAVSDRSGAVNFAISPDATTSSLAVLQSSETVVTVPCFRLIDKIPAGKRCLIKMDIEGFEYRAIAGSLELLGNQSHRWFVELHGWGDPALRKYPLHVLWLFAGEGYRCSRVGTHYLFARGSRPQVAAGILRHAPLLFVKLAYYRYLPFSKPLVERIRAPLRRALRGRRTN